MTPATPGPAYWILMGATGDHRIGGAHILALPAGLAVRQATAQMVKGFSFVFWAFGTWWIPLLILLGVWRHVRRQWPLTYEPSLWSIVFPLGMYSVATSSLGKAVNLGFMTPSEPVHALGGRSRLGRGISRHGGPVREAFGHPAGAVDAGRCAQ